MWYGTVGTVGTLSKVRLVRLPTVPTIPTVPVNRTTVPYQIKGGSRGGRFGCTNTKVVLVHPKRPPLTPPLIWYGTVVRFTGTVGMVRT